MRKAFLNIVIIGFVILDITLFMLLIRTPNNKVENDLSTSKEEKIIVTVAKKNYSKSSHFAELINEFNRINEHNIKIEMIELSKSNYQMELNLRMTSSDQPDIINIEPDRIRTYIRKRWLMELNEYISEDFLRNYDLSVLQYLESYSRNGHIYAFPTSLVTYRLMYNAKLFERFHLDPGKGPITFDKFVEYVRKISYEGREHSIYGLALPLKDPQEGFMKNLEAPSTLSGVHYYDRKKNTVDFTVYQKWFHTIAELIDEKSILPGYETVDMNLGLTQFAEGNIGMIYVSSDDYPLIKSLYQEGDNWKVVMPPNDANVLETDNSLMMSYGDYYGVNRYTEHREAAVIVWQYLCSQDFIQQLYWNGEILPLSSNIRNNIDMLTTEPFIASFLPTDFDVILSSYPEAIEDQHRLQAYFASINQPEDIDEILEKENYYIQDKLSD